MMATKVARLYEQFRPENYNLELAPDREAMAFTGKVTISGQKVGRPSQRLTFHQKDLNVLSAKIIKKDKNGAKELDVERINPQRSLDEVRLHTKDMVYPGEYEVTMEFRGKITRPMNGIYPCFFKHAGQDKSLIATQFESHHAREAFPCIDEPEAKATFDLTLQTPAGETVIANTPVKKQAEHDGLLTTRFETTPKMSVYLLAFVYGDLGFTEGKTKHGVAVRAYATPDNVPLTKHALRVAVKGLEFFEEYFDTPYPLPKLDLLALPDFAAGAMENWGLMTFREVAMLTDDKTSSIESKQMVAMVVGHELSHQWFGDLVTMKWWDDLWLNESFANMMEYLVVDRLYPEWHIWEHFVSSESASAKRRDSLADVQPIKTNVNHPDEISTIFDPSIVYAKGGTVLYMLMNYIGEEAFRTGLRSYFKKHAYGNTAAADLWKALGEASGRDIDGFMTAWLTRPGYPLVTAEWQPGTNSLKLSQRRFLSDPSAHTKQDKPWQVPLSATLVTEPSVLSKASQAVSLTNNNDQTLLLGHDGTSYFLPLYKNPAHLRQIVGAIKGGKVDTIDRLLLVDSYNLLQRGGESSTTDLLELIGAFDKEEAESVWGALALAVAEVRRLVEGDDKAEDTLNKLIEKLIMPTVKRLGWEDGPNDDAGRLRLRGLALSLAAGAKVEPVLTEAKKRFAKFEKPSDLAATIRSVVYFVGARHGSEADFQKLLALHNSIFNADEKEELAAGLTATKEPAQHQVLLAMLNSDAVRRQDFMHWYVWLLRNRYARAATWQWLAANWDWVVKELSSDKTYSYTARYAGSVFSTADELKQFQAFFDKDKRAVIALGRDIALGEQEIISRVAWRQRNQAAVKAWLTKS